MIFIINDKYHSNYYPQVLVRMALVFFVVFFLNFKTHTNEDLVFINKFLKPALWVEFKFISVTINLISVTITTLMK